MNEKKCSRSWRYTYKIGSSSSFFEVVWAVKSEVYCRNLTSGWENFWVVFFSFFYGSRRQARKRNCLVELFNVLFEKEKLWKKTACVILRHFLNNEQEKFNLRQLLHINSMTSFSHREKKIKEHKSLSQKFVLLSLNFFFQFLKNFFYNYRRIQQKKTW